MLDNLIYDRTLKNVQIIQKLKTKRFVDMTNEEKQLWKENIKRGCYTYVDLNRVEEAVKYLDGKIKNAGLVCDIRTRTWTKDDIPTRQDMERYLANIINIRKLNIILSDTPKAPNNIKLTYKDANDIEKILFDVNKVLINKEQQYVYSGEIYSGGDIF